VSDKDPLAELNEHFSRFMQHADGLLREWKSAIDEQTKNLQGRVEREVDAHLDKSVRQSLAQLRTEMERLTARRPGGPAPAMPQPEARSRSLTLGALVSANVLLLILVGFQVKSCAGGGEGPAPGAAPVRIAADAGVRVARPPDAAAAAVGDLAVDAGVPDAAPEPEAKPKPVKTAKPAATKKSSKKRTKSGT